MTRALINDRHGRCEEPAEEGADAAFLRDLAQRIFKIATPAMGFDQSDTDQLYDLARRLTLDQADLTAAEEWRFMECRHCSQYEGDFVADLAADFARHRARAQSGAAS